MTKPAVESGDGGHRSGSSAYRRLLVALFCAGVATFAQLYSPQALLPEISADLSVDAASAALMVSMCTLGLAIGVLPWSVVADHFGRVQVITGAIAAATLLGMVVPFLPSLPVMLAGRLLEGVMVGGVPAVAIAYLTEEVHPADAARAAGTYVAGTTLGGLSGRLISGPVGELFGWRWGMLAVAVLCAVAGLAFATLAPKARGFVPHRHRDSPPEFGLGQLVGVHLRDPHQLALYAQGFLLMGGFVAMYNYLGFALRADPYRLPVWLVSLIFIAYLVGTWSSMQAGPLTERFGRRAVMVAGGLVMALGVALTLVPLLPVLLVGLLVATGGFFLVHSIASGWTSVAARVGKAQAASLYTLLYYAGSSLFGWAGGLAYAAGAWPGTAVMIIVLCVLAVLFAGAALPRDRLR